MSDTMVAPDGPGERASGMSALAPDLDQHRRERIGYGDRMLGSAFDADDAVQGTPAATSAG